MSLRRNIEFKARLTDFGEARRIAGAMATDVVGLELQTDTYFHVARGRLKLREIDGRGAWLIGYERANATAARGSDYRLIEIADGAGIKATLAAALGVLTIVRKEREIFLFRNVRIHLDRVAGLGEFLEFEAVLEDHNDSAGHAVLAELRQRFASVLAEALAGSYSDLQLNVD